LRRLRREKLSRIALACHANSEPLGRRVQALPRRGALSLMFACLRFDGSLLAGDCVTLSEASCSEGQRYPRVPLRSTRRLGLRHSLHGFWGTLSVGDVPRTLLKSSGTQQVGSAALRVGDRKTFGMPSVPHPELRHQDRRLSCVKPSKPTGWGTGSALPRQQLHPVGRGTGTAQEQWHIVAPSKLGLLRFAWVAEAVMAERGQARWYPRQGLSTLGATGTAQEQWHAVAPNKLGLLRFASMADASTAGVAHSCRRASMGWMMAALKAGMMPKKMPTLAEKPRARATDQIGTCTSTIFGCSEAT
jgi:hypothetical protein